MDIVFSPAALPSHCMFCPGSVREKYIDTGMQFEWYGAVYICDECIVSMGRMLGMITKDQADLLIAANSNLSTDTYNLGRELAGLKAGLDGLADAGFGFFDLDTDGSFSARPIEAEESVSEITTESNGGLSASEESVGVGERTSTESVHDETVAGLHPNDESNGSDFRITL